MKTLRFWLMILAGSACYACVGFWLALLIAMLASGDCGLEQSGVGRAQCIDIARLAFGLTCLILTATYAVALIWIWRRRA